MEVGELELKIEELSKAISRLGDGFDYAVEVLKKERSHYVFFYEQKQGFCYFEKQWRDVRTKSDKEEK